MQPLMLPREKAVKDKRQVRNRFGNDIKKTYSPASATSSLTHTHTKRKTVIHSRTPNKAEHQLDAAVAVARVPRQQQHALRHKRGADMVQPRDGRDARAIAQLEHVHGGVHVDDEEHDVADVDERAADRRVRERAAGDDEHEGYDCFRKHSVSVAGSCFYWSWWIGGDVTYRWRGSAT